MEIANTDVIEAFTRRHPQARRPLQHWMQIAEHAVWTSLVDVKNSFDSVDYKSGLCIFNIHGNRYRLIARVLFDAKLVLIVDILTHAQYDRLKL